MREGLVGTLVSPWKLRGFSSAQFGLRVQPLRVAAVRDGGGPSGREKNANCQSRASWGDLLASINTVNRKLPIDSKQSLDAIGDAA